MSEFVNKVVKNGGEWEIQDARVPQPELEDAGKVLGVDEDGTFAFVDGGGSNPTPIEIAFDHNPTFAEIAEAIGGYSNDFTYVDMSYWSYYGSPAKFLGNIAVRSMTEEKCSVMLWQLNENDSGSYGLQISRTSWQYVNKTDCLSASDRNINGAVFSDDLKNYLNPQAPYSGVDGTWILKATTGNNQVNYEWVRGIVVSELPSDASSKTYVLKAINGSLQWIEEQA